MILNLVCRYCFKHKFLFLSNILSLLIGMAVPIYRIILDKKFIFYSDTFYYFIPTIFIFVLSSFFVIIYRKYPICVKILSFIANTLILIVEAFYAFVFCMLLTMLNIDKTFSDPSAYIEALNSIKCQSCIEHFPREIPKNAKDVQLYKSQSSLHGGIDMLLKFNIEETYIKNEIIKSKYIKIEKPTDYTFFYESIVAGCDKKIEMNDFTFYVIKDKSFDDPHLSANTYSYGIGVNEKLNEIIYYFSVLD